MSSTLSSNPHKNPSRKACENIIRRILTTEAEMNGSNRHFKHASDFLSYFESLYPASPSLTKQVQRAVSSMQLAKDSNGYFMIDRTKEDYAAEQELSRLLAEKKLQSLAEATPFYLEIEPGLKQYVIHLMESNSQLKSMITTILESENGIVLYTFYPEQMEKFFEENIFNAG